MGYILVFSIKSAIILSVMFAIYMITVKRHKGACIKRFILLGTYTAAAVLPLFDFRWHPNTVTTGATKLIGGIQSDTPIMSATSHFSIYSVLAMILMAGIFVLLLHLASTFIHVAYLRFKGRTIIIDGVDITVLKHNSLSPFCFGNRIFVSEEEIESMSDMVFCHEKSHVYHQHFYDLLFARLLTIIQWWNPFAWIMLRELQDVHEYQADEDVINDGYSAHDYQYLLLNRAIGKRNPIPSHGIRHSRLRQRLVMINKEKESENSFRRAFLMIFGAVAAVVMISSPLLSPVLLSATNVDLSKSAIFPATKNVATERKVSDISGLNVATERKVFDISGLNVATECKVLDLTVLKPVPDVTINGIEVDMSILNKTSPDQIKEITVRKDSPQHPEGLIEVVLKEGESLSDNSIGTEDHPQTLDEILVVAVGTFPPSNPNNK